MVERVDRMVLSARRSLLAQGAEKLGEDAIDIATWLQQIGLGEHTETFRTEKIDAAVLPTLTDADLRELGLPLGDRKKLRAAIDALGTTPFPGAPSTPEPLQGAARRLAGEQRHLTVMFCDIVDSTRLAATLELENLRHVVDAYQKKVATCAAQYEGFVAKFMGDGVLVYFGYPQAHEDDAERAIRAGLDIVTAMPSVRAIHGPELACRIGISSGVVVVGEFISVGAAAELTVLGEAPNLAARLQTVAPRNGVIIAASTRALVGNLFELKPIDPMALKGFGAAASRPGRSSPHTTTPAASAPPATRLLPVSSAAMPSLRSSLTVGPSLPPERDNFFCCRASPVSANPVSAKLCFRTSSSRMPKSVCNARPTTPTARSIRYCGISNAAPLWPTRSHLHSGARVSPSYSLMWKRQSEPSHCWDRTLACSRPRPLTATHWQQSRNPRRAAGSASCPCCRSAALHSRRRYAVDRPHHTGAAQPPN